MLTAGSSFTSNSGFQQAEGIGISSLEKTTQLTSQESSHSNSNIEVVTVESESAKQSRLASQIWESTREKLSTVFTSELSSCNASKVHKLLDDLVKHWSFQNKYNSMNNCVAQEIIGLYFKGLNWLAEEETEWIKVLSHIDTFSNALRLNNDKENNNNNNNNNIHNAPRNQFQRYIDQLLLFQAEIAIACGLLSKASESLKKFVLMGDEDVSKFFYLQCMLLLSFGDADGAQQLSLGIRNKYSHEAFLLRIAMHIALGELQKAAFLLEHGKFEVYLVIIEWNKVSYLEHLKKNLLRSDILVGLSMRNPRKFLIKLLNLQMRLRISCFDYEGVVSDYQEAKGVFDGLGHAERDFDFAESLCNFAECKINLDRKGKSDIPVYVLDNAMHVAKSILKEHYNRSTLVGRIYELKAKAYIHRAECDKTSLNKSSEAMQTAISLATLSMKVFEKGFAQISNDRQNLLSQFKFI